MTAAPLLALALAATAARPLSFHAAAEKAEVRLGEPFGYRIEVRHRPDERYALPEKLALEPFQAAGPGRCERALPLSLSKGQGERPEEEAVTTCTLTLALFALGDVDVPDLPLAVGGPAGDAVLAVPGPRVTGVGLLDPSAPPESLRLRDLAPPAPLLVRTWRRVAWALGLLAAAALVLLAARAWRRRARGGAEPAPPVPPHLRLARRLDALEAERLPARGLAREHVARVSELVREYLGALGAGNALDLTTSELLLRLEREGDPRLDLARLRALLEGADLVKFARAAAGAAECGAATAFARDLLARTAPAPQPDGAAPVDRVASSVRPAAGGTAP